MASNFFSIPTTVWKSFAGPQRHAQTTRKRKRDDESKDHSENDDLSSSARDDHISASPARQPSPPKPRLIRTPDDIAQFRIAGHAITEPLPENPFPHRSARKDDEGHRTHQTLRQVSEGNEGITRARTLRQQHLSVLTTILQRCIIQKDFVRARRAFGLLLREEFGGQAFDVRTGASWGLGAEILIHADEEKTSLPPIPTIFANDHSTSDQRGDALWNSPRFGLTRDSFKLIKRYLESLSVQYAYSSSHPRAFSAVDFKLAMFELWIHMLHGECRRIANERSYSPTHDLSETHIEDHPSDLLLSANTTLSDSLNAVLNEARDIRHQLETLMQAATYSNRPDYLNLHKGVLQWIVDLELRISERSSSVAGSSLISGGS